MACSQTLFLLGGEPALAGAAESFVAASGGRRASIVLLLQGGTNWARHLPCYLDPWIRMGVTQCEVIAPDGTFDLNIEDLCCRLNRATGIFIGGGDPRWYQRFYAGGPVAETIRKRYREGVPVGGMSAGALILPGVCVLPACGDDDESLSMLPGLNLISGLVVEVHFSESNGLPHVLRAMAAMKTLTAWGLDEPAGAVFVNGAFYRTTGRPVYEITITNFERHSYHVHLRSD